MRSFQLICEAKGQHVALPLNSFINIMWTQVAPVVFKNIGWKLYMVFISCCVASATIMYFTFPDTLNKPLEEVAAMFGDDDLVAVYQKGSGRW
jgi:RsiW-degrading membrane proteinase PrsW (M82 family)